MRRRDRSTSHGSRPVNTLPNQVKGLGGCPAPSLAGHRARESLTIASRDGRCGSPVCCRDRSRVQWHTLAAFLLTPRGWPRKNPDHARSVIAREWHMWQGALRDWPAGQLTPRLRVLSGRSARVSGGLCSCRMADRPLRVVTL